MTASSSNRLVEFYCLDCSTSYDGMRCPKCGSFRRSFSFRDLERKDKVQAYLESTFGRADSMRGSGVKCFCGRPQPHVLAYPMIKEDGEHTDLTSLPFCPFRIRTFSDSLRAFDDDYILDKMGV